MNLERLPETNLEKGLTHYGDSLTLFGEMVEVSHRQTPRKDCDAKAPRQDSTISELRLGIALPPGSDAPLARIAGGAPACTKESLYLPLSEGIRWLEPSASGQLRQGLGKSVTSQLPERELSTRKGRSAVVENGSSVADTVIPFSALAAVPLCFCATSTRIHSRRPGHL